MWHLFRKAHLKVLSYFVTTPSGLWKTHTDSKEPETPPSTTLIGDFVWYRREENAKPRTDKSFQQTTSQIRGQDLTCPGFQAQKSDSRLACNFSWHCSPTSLTSTTPSATLCRNPSLQSHKKRGKGPNSSLRSLPNKQESTDLLSPQGPFPSQQPCSFLHTPEKGKHFNSSSSCFARWAARGDSWWAYTHT